MNCKLDLSLPITCDGCEGGGGELETITFTPRFAGDIIAGEYEYSENIGLVMMRGGVGYMSIRLGVSRVVTPGSGYLMIEDMPLSISEYYISNAAVNFMHNIIPNGFVQIGAQPLTIFSDGRDHIGFDVMKVGGYSEILTAQHIKANSYVHPCFTVVKK